MEFHYTSQTQAEGQMRTDTNLEFEGVEDSDIYYAELRKQILLLTADDDEEFAVTNHSRLVDIQKKQDSNSLSSSTFPTTLQPGSYFDWWERQKTDSVPTWLENLWRSNGNGTGVFIPQIVKPRRYRHGMCYE
ncbi:unnamed protein product [Dovyalis caffra]|uniref:Uncharacterized protein n=1 Tax=Dovyalis caffra TaxID=77055 RepID=A0AAV1QZP4_9ROSI|nr:unnamed protein product [Dovyalis caffra]